MNKFVINSLNIVCVSNYNLPTNTDCTICRCNLNNNSLYNQDKGVDSCIIQGLCNHSFHAECILPWLAKNKHCPICSSVWIDTKYYS
jgi:hypothetical protein